METGVIYKITCIGNGMYLYGSTLFFEKRMKDYINAFKRGDYKNNILQRSINKYGIDSFHYEIVQDNIPENILEAVEDIWIGANCSRSDDYKGGMNIRDAQRWRHSEETKEKIRKSKKGRFCGKNNHMFGKEVSEETREKLRQINLGNKHTEETKEKCRAYKHTPEAIEIIRQTGKERFKGAKWINNGVINKRLRKKEPLPKGYNYGAKENTWS